MGKQYMNYLKYLLYILLILMIPTSAFAQGQLFQTSKIVVCGSTEVLMKGLKEIGEIEISLLGSLDNVQEGEHVIVTLHRSDRNGTFSVVESSVSGISCMVSVGKIVPAPAKNETEIEPKGVPKVIPDRNGATKTLWQKGRRGIAIKFQVSQ
jgi:hypothetical protein